ncbi:MAG: NYN domain-containing protein [Bacteroidota bacterium]
MSKRAIFYFDASNFRKGLEEKIRYSPKWERKYQWLDFVKFSETFLDKDDHLIAVKFFTARYIPDNEYGRRKRKNQKALIGANQVINKSLFKPVYGYYKRRTTIPNCKQKCKEPLISYEEKMTDISISAEMIGDCIKNSCDKLVLLSGDNDLIPSINLIQKKYSDKKIKLYLPPRRGNNVDKLKHLLRNDLKYLDNEGNRKRFDRSLLPFVVKDQSNTYKIPSYWNK